MASNVITAYNIQGIDYYRNHNTSHNVISGCIYSLEIVCSWGSVMSGSNGHIAAAHQEKLIQSFPHENKAI